MKLNGLFSDGAVFQRRAPIPVFGFTDPDSVVEITFNGNQFCGAAGHDGYFCIRMAAMEAGGPYEMTVRNRRTGDSATVQRIYTGEVFLASGQSNMCVPFGQDDAQYERFSSALPPEGVSIFNVAFRASGVEERLLEGCWVNSADPASRNLSATAQWFGLALWQKLQIPVGIIKCAHGGTIPEAWISRNALLGTSFASYLRTYETNLPRPARWDNVSLEAPQPQPGEFLQKPEDFPKYLPPQPPLTGLDEGWAEAGFDDASWTDYDIPGSWTDDGICGNGTVWARFHVEIPSAWEGKELILHLGPVDKQDITFFNGEEIGRSGKDFDLDCWDKPRTYRIPGRLVRAGKAVVAVRAWSFIYIGAFAGTADDYYLETADSSARLKLPDRIRIKAEHDFGLFPPLTIYHGEYEGPWFPNSPGILFDGMLRPVMPYAIRGAVWYQGESTADCGIESAKRYGELLETLIRDWRFHWGIGNFPFLIVQLPLFRGARNYDENAVWPVIRQAQLDVARKLPACELAVALDLGEQMNIHPVDKEQVGRRLADLACRHVYGMRGIREGGPIPVACRRENDALRIFFRNADSGLVLRESKESGFFCAGAVPPGKQPRYHAAEAAVEGTSVVVRSPSVPEPRFVRYAWADNPAFAPLYNGDGVPASPFEYED